jgi:uncharacterized 2Fe-2S/4Fe-4S cluster protein (DUF4445 family)
LTRDEEENIEFVFEPDGNKIRVLSSSSILEAANLAGNRIRSECGGNGNCGKCRVIVEDQKSLTDLTVHEEKHLTSSEIEKGYRLACQAMSRKNVVVFIPPESRVEKRKIQSTGVERPVQVDPLTRKFNVRLIKPSLSDIRPDYERLLDFLKREHDLENLEIEHSLIRKIPRILREAQWNVTVATWNQRIVAVEPGDKGNDLYGLSIDVGTSKIVVHLVDLENGLTKGIGSIENPQIMFGEDLITRISYTMSREGGLKTLQNKAVEGINEAIQDAIRLEGVDPNKIYEATVVGNTAMHHFLLAIEPRYIARSPFVPATKTPINVKAKELKIMINPNGVISFLPLIAGFVGADAIADILASGIADSQETSMLLDIGTNTEIFLGNQDDIFTCSCASGPAFEGGHIKHGMKAVTGAIEKFTLNPETDEVEYKIIGENKPRGLCGSAILDIVAELFKHGILNNKGRFDADAKTPRLMKIDGKLAFVIVPKEESATGKEIVVTQKDVNEILLAKAAIYSGCSILMKRKELREEDISEILIAGAFGNYINPDNAKLIGMIPNVPSENIRFIGNSAITGAKMALVSKEEREKAETISRTVRYLELSNDPSFRSEFASAIFLPHRTPDRSS